MLPGLKLLKKIFSVDFATDYSTGGYDYPPKFAWYPVRNSKKIETQLIKAISLSQDNFQMYVHFPFCETRCAFCRFYSIVNNQPYSYYKMLGLMIRELEFWSKIIHRAQKIKGKIPLESIYLGGGTPTLFNLEIFFKQLLKNFDLKKCRQINLESTPNALNKEKLLFYKKIGVNRLLIGIQSLDSEVLTAMNRYSEQINVLKKNFKIARKIGLPFITFELIIGLPKQTVSSFLKDLVELIKLKPDGIHIYNFLATPLSTLGKRGYKLDTVAKSNCSKMFLASKVLLEKAGYVNNGDEWIMRGKERARNFQQEFGRPNLLTIGPSATGIIKTDNYVLLFSNNLNHEGYADIIANNHLPLGKYFILKGEDEIIRSKLIKNMRYSQFENRSCYNNYYKEFNLLEKKGIIKFSDTIIKVLYPGWNLFAKVFYSPQIIKRCKAVIRKKYSRFKFNNQK